jgi:predicted phage terminase large subunit-like protein
LFFKETALADGPGVVQWVPIDPGAAGKTALRHFQTLLPPGYAVMGYAQTANLGNKVKRARDASSLAEQGALEMVRAPWNTFLLAQLEPFPNPRIHDDAVDALSAAVNNPPAVSSWDVKGAAV